MVTKEWVAIHRKHHAQVRDRRRSAQPADARHPDGLLEGAELYRAEAKNAETIEKYGHGTPDDWIERNVYTRFSWEGVGLMLMHQPDAVRRRSASRSGRSRWCGSRSRPPASSTASATTGATATSRPPTPRTNIVPWGILIGGEELHNNHHAYGTSAKLSSRWYEFDLGWMYIRILEMLGLAKVRKVAPKLRVEPAASRCRTSPRCRR